MKNLNEIQEAFKTFGFSAQEARLYVSLLEGGKVNGSELAKRLGLTRASVYGTLNSIVEKGAAYLIPGNPQLFEAVPYRLLIQKLKKNTADCLALIERELKELPRHSSAEQVINFPDENLFSEELRAAFAMAKKEIYLSVCAPIEQFKSEIDNCLARGVRIIGFTMNAAHCLGRAEWYTRELRLPSHDFNQRILAVFDMELCLTGGSDTNENFLGIATRNPLLVKLLAEHIHHDIYLARMQEKNGADPVKKEYLLSTLHENKVCCSRRKTQ